VASCAAVVALPAPPSPPRLSSLSYSLSSSLESSEDIDGDEDRDGDDSWLQQRHMQVWRKGWIGGRLDFYLSGSMVSTSVAYRDRGQSTDCTGQEQSIPIEYYCPETNFLLAVFINASLCETTWACFFAL
jgi:hypothetical protein